MIRLKFALLPVPKFASTNPRSALRDGRVQQTVPATGVNVYFCEPRSPWQRPSNEQTTDCYEGTYLPTSPAHLALIEDNRNPMPRKLHNR